MWDFVFSWFKNVLSLSVLLYWNAKELSSLCPSAVQVGELNVSTLLGEQCFRAEGGSALESKEMRLRFLDVTGQEEAHCCCCLNSHQSHFSIWVRCPISDFLYPPRIRAQTCLLLPCTP